MKRSGFSRTATDDDPGFIGFIRWTVGAFLAALVLVIAIGLRVLGMILDLILALCIVDLFCEAILFASRPSRPERDHE